MTTLSYIVVALAMLTLGISIGKMSVLLRVRSGRLIHAGRIYWCKDTGPIVR